MLDYGLKACSFINSLAIWAKLAKVPQILISYKHILNKHVTSTCIWVWLSENGFEVIKLTEWS